MWRDEPLGCQQGKQGTGASSVFMGWGGGGGVVKEGERGQGERRVPVHSKKVH